MGYIMILCAQGERLLSVVTHPNTRLPLHEKKTVKELSDIQLPI